MTGFLRRHRVLLVLLAGGVLLRVLTAVAYRPALIYIDSMAAYLNSLSSLDPTGPDPVGYDLVLLKPVLAVGNLATVAAVQHVLGLGMAVVVYALLARTGAPRWLAALAAAPVLLDAYQVQIEQNVMSDSLLQALLLAALTVLAWPRRPGWRTALAAGLLLGIATTVRLTGAPAILAAAGYALLSVRGWQARLLVPAVAVVGFAVPVAGYAVWYHHWTGRYGLSHQGGEALYGRVATFADCTGLRLPADERVLCPGEPPDARAGPEFWAHDATSPRFHLDIPPGLTDSDVLTDFSLRIIRHQPVDFVRAVLRDGARALSWQRVDANPEAPVERWRFQTAYPQFPPLVTVDSVAQLGAQYGGGRPVVVVPLARGLRWYQLHLGYTPGPVLGLAALLALAGARRQPVAGLVLAAGVGVLASADVFEFTWRYQLPALVLLPAAGALGVTALFGRRPAVSRFPEPADETAEAEFQQRYGDARFPPVVVVIAAYNEARTIGEVVAAVPREHAVLVVDDGSGDGTADAARGHGAYTCAVAVNRGQGAALRLGYHLARTRGAEFIVTTDADGQYDIGQLPVLLEPLLSGEADFVTGSRRLGADESTDPVRRAGVRVFAWLVSALTGQRITDTSFGLRAMRAEVTAGVTLSQPQYQSSELLVGALSRGYRVVERPMTMRRRSTGTSKKGNNLVYGLRYARVVLTTWWRERGRTRPGPAVRT